MVSLGLSKYKIRKEMNKCEILCSNCHRKHHQTTNKKRKKYSEAELLVMNIKKINKCGKCSEDTACCLDFHHINPETKKFTIGNALKMKISTEEMLEELKKCIILCSNCHRKAHLKYHLA